MESYSDKFLTPEDLAKERAYFSLISELLDKNKSRYENEARELIKNGKRFSNIDGCVLQFKLARVGCSFKLSGDQGKTFEERSWTRLGWRKSAKLTYLPFFFAGCEATVLLEK